MAIIQDPTVAAQQARVGAAASMALHAQLRPLPGDHFRFAGKTTTHVAPTAGAVEFAVRNPDAAKLLVVYRLEMRAIASVAYPAAQEFGFDLVYATGYTAAETNGTGVNLGSQNKLRRSMANSILGSGNMRINAAVVAGLSGGTKTLDVLPMAMLDGGIATGIGAMVGPLDLGGATDAGFASPLVIPQNEGFVLRNLILGGATGSVVFSVNMMWAEVPIADF